MYGAEHALDGIVGYEVAETTDETTDENPERVAIIQRLSTAYLRTALRVDEKSWTTAREAFHNRTNPDRPRRR